MSKMLDCFHISEAEGVMLSHDNDGFIATIYEKTTKIRKGDVVKLRQNGIRVKEILRRKKSNWYKNRVSWTVVKARFDSMKTDSKGNVYDEIENRTYTDYCKEKGGRYSTSDFPLKR